MQLVPHACPHPPSKALGAFWVGMYLVAVGWLATLDSPAYVVAAACMLPIVALQVVDVFASRVLMTTAEAKRHKNWTDPEIQHVYAHLCAGRTQTVAYAGFLWAIIGAAIISAVTSGETQPAQVGVLAASVIAIWVAVWQWSATKMRHFEKNPHVH